MSLESLQNRLKYLLDHRSQVIETINENIVALQNKQNEWKELDAVSKMLPSLSDEEKRELLKRCTEHLHDFTCVEGADGGTYELTLILQNDIFFCFSIKLIGKQR